jgi:hypothetical protein
MYNNLIKRSLAFCTVTSIIISASFAKKQRTTPCSNHLRKTTFEYQSMVDEKDDEFQLESMVRKITS